MQPILDVKNATVRFGGLVAVDNASLTIQKGQLIGFVGPNGAGKTTLMRVITGIVKPQEGSVHLDGRNLDGLTINQRIRAGMALAQQIVQPLRQMTLLENVALACGRAKTASPFLAMKSFDRASERDRAMTLLAHVGLEKAAHSEPSKLPLGYLKRLEVARALALDPKLLLLDEPLAGLLKAAGIAIILVEQNTERALKVADEVCVLEAGNMIWSGSAADANKDTGLTKRLMGIH